MKWLLPLILILLIPVILPGASYRFATELFSDGLYEEAILEFEKVIAEFPTSKEAQDALFHIGESYRLQENWSAAEESYSRLMHAYPDNQNPDRNQYYLALMKYKQKKYRNAENEFAGLVKNYPNSDYSRRCLVDYLLSIFNQGSYEKAIKTGEELIENYQQNDAVPMLLLITARAHFEIGQSEKGKDVLDKIKTGYPSSDARWQMLDLEMQLWENEKGNTAVIDELNRILQDTIPRQYEKKLRWQLVDKYLETDNRQQAMQELELMLAKYDNAEDLDEIVIKYLKTGIQVQSYWDKLIDRERFDKIFRESIFRDEYEMLLGWAHLNIHQIMESQVIVNKLLEKNPSDELVARVHLLAAEIAKQKSRYREAIEHLQQALALGTDNTAAVLMEIGGIYKNHFMENSTALNYFQEVTFGNYPAKDKVSANIAAADCYRDMGETDEAVRILKSISMADAAKAEMEQEISLYIDHLKKYELQDYKQAFNHLVSSLSSYMEHNNRNLMQQNLAEIVAYDLKDYETAAALLPENTPETGYRKALILLAQAEKYNKTHPRDLDKAGYAPTPADELLLKVNTIIYNLQESLPPDRKEELRIKKMRWTAGNTIDNEITMLENYLRAFPDGEARNEFLLDLAQNYTAKKDTVKLMETFRKLKQDKRIAEEDYYEAKIKLADHYYYSGDFTSAWDIYQEVQKHIDYDKPEVMYHYARTLNELQGGNRGLDKVEFLVNNLPGFASYNEALLYLIDALRRNDERYKAVEYAQYVPHDLRNSDFYKMMAEDYLHNDMPEEAKQSLMRIEDKDNATLLKLADLQYLTGDHSMALYSYGILEDKGETAAIIYQRSGDIYFEQEEFTEAIRQYEKYLKNAAEQNDNYRKVVVSYIVSYYRIKNRPKAEDLQKTYKKIITDKDKKEIALAEAVYYSEMDSKKAEKLFDKLLKMELEADLMISSYFWRGMLYLKNQNIPKAKEDFETVAQAKNQELANQARFKLGLINFSQENYEAALDNYYHVIKHDESGKLALDAAQNFAKVCKTIEEWEKAIAAYEIILEKWGDQTLQSATKFDIAFCYFRDKDYDKAIEMFQQVIPLLEDRNVQAEAQYWTGMSYFEKDDFEKAVTELLKVSYSYETYTQWAASAELQAGEAYQKLDSKEKARRIYNRVIEKYGSGSQWGTLAKQRLAEM